MWKWHSFSDLPSSCNLRKYYDDSWAFYLCNELDCGFSFKHRSGVKWAAKKEQPVLEVDVKVIALNKKVNIKFVGFGEDGYKSLLGHGHEEYIFPIDLFSRPYKIDPKPSKRCSEHLYEKWLKTIESYREIRNGI